MFSKMFSLAKKFPDLKIPEEVTILVYRQESTWECLDKDEISLCQSEKGYFLKGRPVREPVRDYCSENNNEIKLVPVSKKWVTSLLKRLEHTCIPAFPPPRVGADGGYTELEIGGYCGKAHYRWWSLPPEGWEKLDEIAMEIRNKFYQKGYVRSFAYVSY